MQSQPVNNFGFELKDVIPSAIYALNAKLLPSGPADSRLDIAPSSHVVVLLIDGLGELQLQDFGAGLFLTQSMTPTPMRTQFPSTTPVALASLGTGQSPGQHGFVGASFYLPEEDALLAPLKWGSSPHPIAMTPSAPLFEWAAGNGIDVASIAREKHRNSGITKSVLRGGVYLGAAELVEMERIVVDRIENASAPALTYIYWPDLDRIGHVHGPGSQPWRDELISIDSFIGRLANVILDRPHAGVSLVVTSDHGMVYCPAERRILLESEADLTRDVKMIAGDPRARHVYTRSGAAVDTAMRWQARLGNDFSIVLREELVRGSLFTNLDPDFHQRLGDFMAIAQSDALLASSSDTRTSALLGQHGSVSAAEMQVPLRIFQTGSSG